MGQKTECETAFRCWDWKQTILCFDFRFQHFENDQKLLAACVCLAAWKVFSKINHKTLLHRNNVIFPLLLRKTARNEQSSSEVKVSLPICVGSCWC